MKKYINIKRTTRNKMVEKMIDNQRQVIEEYKKIITGNNENNHT